MAAGTIRIEQVLELLLQQLAVNRRLMARVELLETRLARYEPPPPSDSQSAAPSDYSVAAEERRRRRKKVSRSGGRKPTEVSDDATVYQRRFDSAQKCWAHLLRKAIKLALLYPEKPHYQVFLDDLLTLDREAKRAQADRRLSDTGRAAKVAVLETRMWDVCSPHQSIGEHPRSPDERDFSNLVHELFRLLEADELFTFVRQPEVEPTNNLSERGLRGPALDRQAGRASKTAAGAARRSVIQSVLESLRKHLPEFTLPNVIAETTRWMTSGLSLFREQLTAARTQLKLADTG